MSELGLNLVLLLTILIPISFAVGVAISRFFIYKSQIADENRSLPEIILDKIESFIFKLCNINPSEQMSGMQYMTSLLLFNFIIGISLFTILSFQIQSHFSQIDRPFDISTVFHCICAYITNTDQDHFQTDFLPLATKYLIIPFLMFISSGTGLSVGIMFIRSITKGVIGNFFSDFIRVLIRILFPICLIISIVFVVLGSPNTLPSIVSYETLEGMKETFLIGPIAAIEAVKILGQNGGSVYSANASHPLSNPSYLTNFIQSMLMLIIPVALIFTLGFALKNNKQAIVLVVALFSILVFEMSLSTIFELNGVNNSGANWTGKETRFGIVGSTFFSLISTNASGATNSALDSYHPISIGIILFNMANQGIFGGQGLGVIYALNFFIYTAIFIGFMIGKFPELFNRKIEKNEIILSSLLLLLSPFLVFIGVIVTINLQDLSFNSFYDHIHHYTRTLYEFLSAATNNGSGLEGLKDNTPILNYTLGTIILIGWYGSIMLIIALASSLAQKTPRLAGAGTFRTDTILFTCLYLFMTVTLTLLTYFPFIIVGPISEILGVK